MSKNYFFSLQPDILASSNLTKLQVNFWKKLSKLAKSSGFSGVLTVFKLFFVVFSWSEKPKIFEKPEISSKSRFWNFFSHYDLFTFSELKFWKPNITMCRNSDRPNEVGNRCIMSLTKLKQLYWKQKSSFWLIFGLI